MSTSNAHAEDRAIAALVRKGANFSVNKKDQVTKIHLYDAVLRETDVQHFAYFPQLVELSLGTCKVGNAIWLHITKSSALESLKLWGSAITNKDMENLRLLPRLKRLDIRATRITDRGLAHVAQLESLEVLELL